MISWVGRKGLRWSGFALFLVRFCGNFYFNSRYCGFKTLTSLRLLQPLGSGFRWKKVSVALTLFRTVGIRLLCKREPSVSFYNASTFIVSVVCNYGPGLQLRPFRLMWLTVLANDATTSWNSMSDVSSYSRTASCSRCIEVNKELAALTSMSFRDLPFL